jgi:hypothetical protein
MMGKCEKGQRKVDGGEEDSERVWVSRRREEEGR